MARGSKKKAPAEGRPRAPLGSLRTLVPFAAVYRGRILAAFLSLLMASLATLVPAISGLIGHRQDSKHMVATVTVWFHPARSIGSMHEVSLALYLCASTHPEHQMSSTSHLVRLVRGRM